MSHSTYRATIITTALRIFPLNASPAVFGAGSDPVARIGSLHRRPYVNLPPQSGGRWSARVTVGHQWNPLE